MTDAIDPTEHAAASRIGAGASGGCARVNDLAPLPRNTVLHRNAPFETR